MDFKLAKVLYEKNELTQGVIIKAKYTAVDMAGRHSFETIDEFLVIYASIKAEMLILHCSHKKSGMRRNLTHDCILEINGMTPDRIADSIDLTIDGNAKKIGNKRGRKTNEERARLANL
jgi:hypothetical protein